MTPAEWRLTKWLAWIAIATVYCAAVEVCHAEEYELHLVKADSHGHCEQGKAYAPDFGTVKLHEMEDGHIGVHYCISIREFERIKKELGEANPARAK